DRGLGRGGDRAAAGRIPTAGALAATGRTRAVLLLHRQAFHLRLEQARNGLPHFVVRRAGTAAGGRVLGLYPLSRAVEATAMKRRGFILVLVSLLGCGALVMLGKMDQKTDLSAVLEMWGDALRDGDRAALQLTRISDERE